MYFRGEENFWISSDKKLTRFIQDLSVSPLTAWGHLVRGTPPLTVAARTDEKGASRDICPAWVFRERQVDFESNVRSLEA